MSGRAYDAAVVGAGVFGAWAALALLRRGRSVALLDAYGPANSRASSGGESRVIRAGYGAEELYTRWAVRSLALWKEFAEAAGEAGLFQRTGVLWLARARDALVSKTRETLARVGVGAETLTREELERRFPQFDFGGADWGLYEPGAGVLMARRAVRAVVERFRAEGGVYIPASASAPAGAGGRVERLAASGGVRVEAGACVFACGPWLPKLFPSLLGRRIRVSRQEVFFFGTPLGDNRFAPPLMPTWVDFGGEIYGIPDLEGRGLKLALDRHGPDIDPDTDARLPTQETLAEVRRQLSARFPVMRDAPLVEARVCQYENTSNGDFLIDRHPDYENVWLAGGGSGHGFKHGPAVGEYVASLVAGGGPAEPRFSLAAKEKFHRRTIF